MSIHHEVNRLCANGLLEGLSLGTGEPELRSICVAEPMNRILSGPWPNDNEWEQAEHLKADLSRFIRGGLITVSEDPDEKTCQLKRLQPGRREVWEIRSREPLPGIRVFGRFADKDLFVAFCWEDRMILGPKNSETWKYHARRCVADWTNYFPNHLPVHNGRFPDDYISNTYVL
jgi:hypothetical protein